MSDGEGGSPGSQWRNWSPATNIDDYLRNCREGLETYSDRHAAGLLGWSRAMVWRAKLVNDLPRDLFEALISEERRSVPSVRELAKISLALQGRSAAEIDRCPHCGAALRVRSVCIAESAAIVDRWLATQ
jgi:hypothetical protein